MHMFLANPGDWWEHLERLGGWAVVAWLVVWGVKRMNKRDDQMTDLLERHKKTLLANQQAIALLKTSVDSTVGLEKEERRIHDLFDQKLDLIIEQTRKDIP